MRSVAVLLVLLGAVETSAENHAPDCRRTTTAETAGPVLWPILYPEDAVAAARATGGSVSIGGGPSAEVPDRPDELATICCESAWGVDSAIEFSGLLPDSCPAAGTSEFFPRLPGGEWFSGSMLSTGSAIDLPLSVNPSRYGGTVQGFFPVWHQSSAMHGILMAATLLVVPSLFLLFWRS